MACSIIPAVLQNTKEELTEVYHKMAPLSNKIHIDVSDGLFTPYKSYPYTMKERRELLPAGNSLFSVHLMVKHPLEIAQKYIDAGAQELIVHIESFESTTQLLTFIHMYKQKVVITLAITSHTSIETLFEALDVTSLTSVMIMTITDIGKQGGDFDRSSLTKISEVRSRYPRIRITTDGSINATNIYDVSFAGADECIVGSALVRAENPQEAYATLTARVAHT